MSSKKRPSIWAACAVIACLIFACGKIKDYKSDSWIRDRVVKLSSPAGMCSGEQISAPSGETYILTAAHCAGLAQEGQMDVTTESGKVLKRRVIAEDANSDLLLLEGLPNVSGLSIAKSQNKGQSIRTFTHGFNLSTYETSGVLIESRKVEIPLSEVTSEEEAQKCSSKAKNKMEVGLFGAYCEIDVFEVFSTAFVQHGSSGGMVIDSSGDLVGVVSASGEGYSLFVRLSDIQAFLANY